MSTKLPKQDPIISKTLSSSYSFVSELRLTCKNQVVMFLAASIHSKYPLRKLMLRSHEQSSLRSLEEDSDQK
ncbi:MAG: hypothetical protein AB8G05_27110 [Oligoflexales bacterium]